MLHSQYPYRQMPGILARREENLGKLPLWSLCQIEEENMTDKSPTNQNPTDLDSFLTDLRANLLSEARKLRADISSEPSARGRLIFGLDATASREETWDTACHLQAEMFWEAGKVGGLEMQLVYYRDISECRASRWMSDSGQLARAMTKIMCRAGHTQLRKVLAHAQRETGLLKVSALIFIGDALEEEDDVLIPAAKELGDLGVPAFMFQEGSDRLVEQTFRDVARLTHGAYCRFDPGAARQLAELLRAVAVYAVGGLSALADRRDLGAIKLLGQLK